MVPRVSGGISILPFLSSSLPSRSFLSKTFSWNDKCCDHTIISNDCRKRDDNKAKAKYPMAIIQSNQLSWPFTPWEYQLTYNVITLWIFDIFLWTVLWRSFHRSKKIVTPPPPPIKDMVDHPHKFLVLFWDANGKQELFHMKLYTKSC